MDEKKADGIKLVNNNYEASGQVVKHFYVISEKKRGFRIVYTFLLLML